MLSREGRTAQPVMPTEGLIQTETATDLLIYDSEAQALHSLNPVLRQVWQACDGSRTVENIVAVTNMERDVVDMALSQLRVAGLIETSGEDTLPSSHSRRRVLKKAMLSSLAIPAIVSVTAPQASAHHSPGHVCTAKTCGVDAVLGETCSVQCHTCIPNPNLPSQLYCGGTPP